MEVAKDDGITKQLAMQWFDLKKSLFEVKSIVGLWVIWYITKLIN